MRIRIETISEHCINDIISMAYVENRSLTSNEMNNIRALALESKQERITLGKAVDAFLFGIDLLLDEVE